MTEKTEDDLIEELYQQRAAKHGKEPEPPKAPEPEPDLPPTDGGEGPVEPQGSAPEAPHAAPVDEPFPGYSTLSEDVRKQFDALREKARQAEELAPKLDKLQKDYQAQVGRNQPTQQRLAQLERELAQYRQQVPSKPQTQQQRMDMQAWLKDQPEERRRHFQEFPDELRLAFEVAQDLASRQAAQVEEHFNRRLSEFEKRQELQSLAREHPDFADFKLVDNNPVTQRGASFWAWYDNQPPEIQGNLNRAEDVSRALSVYKWEEKHAGVMQEIQSAPFQGWIAEQPPAIQRMLSSPNISDRDWVLRQYVAFEDANQQGDTPEAKRARELAEKRKQQATRVAPSVHGHAAPAPAAAPGSEDAALEAAYQARKQRFGR